MGIFSPSEKKNFIDPIKAKYVLSAQQLQNSNLRKYVYASVAITEQLLDSFLKESSPAFLRRQRERLDATLAASIFRFWALEDLSYLIGFEEVRRQNDPSLPVQDMQKFTQEAFDFFEWSNTEREILGTLLKLNQSDPDTYAAYLWGTFRQVLGDIEPFTPEEAQFASNYNFQRSEMFRKLVQ